MDEKDPLFIAVLAVLGSLVGVIIIFACCWYFKRRKQRRYLHLQDGAESEETGLLRSLRQPRIKQAQAQEGAALLTCHFYMRTTGEYTCHSQLSQIGSNPEKNWFLITPIAKAGSLSPSTASHLLTLQPKSDRLSQWTDETSTVAYARTLNNLFSRLFHPYVEPLVRLDILYSQKLVVTVKQYQRLGSLKDVLHGAVPTAHFHVSSLTLTPTPQRVHRYSFLLVGQIFLSKFRTISRSCAHLFTAIARRSPLSTVEIDATDVLSAQWQHCGRRVNHSDWLLRISLSRATFPYLSIGEASDCIDYSTRGNDAAPGIGSTLLRCTGVRDAHWIWIGWTNPWLNTQTLAWLWTGCGCSTNADTSIRHHSTNSNASWNSAVSLF